MNENNFSYSAMKRKFFCVNLRDRNERFFYNLKVFKHLKWKWKLEADFRDYFSRLFI